MEGHCDPRFVAVQDAFRENLGEEIGAAVVVSVGGRTVVDLAGGWADAAAHAAMAAPTRSSTCSAPARRSSR